LEVLFVESEYKSIPKRHSSNDSQFFINDVATENRSISLEFDLFVDVMQSHSSKATPISIP